MKAEAKRLDELYKADNKAKREQKKLEEERIKKEEGPKRRGRKPKAKVVEQVEEQTQIP